MSAPSEAPSHRYYRAMHGRWRGRFAMQATDAEALATSPMGAWDRLQVRSLLLAPRYLGPLTMDTTLDYRTAGERGRVVHTTRVSKFGLPLFTSVDLFTLGDDGRSVVVGGHQRSSPLFLAVPQVGSVRIDEDGEGAVYDLPVFGGRLDQRTRTVPGGLRIEQNTGWGRASFVLERISAEI